MSKERKQYYFTYNADDVLRHKECVYSIFSSITFICNIRSI